MSSESDSARAGKDAVLESLQGALRARGDSNLDLPGEMQTLSGMIRDLEAQLDRMIEINDALQEELDTERHRRVRLEADVQRLQDALRRSEEDAATHENLASEVQQLNQERAQLLERLRDTGDRLQRAERELEGRESLAQQLRVAREDALAEVQSVEAQFERSMEMLLELRTQVTVLSEERDALAGRLRVTDDKVRELSRERDYLFTEVEQSRSALDEIRRQLVDAVMAPRQGRREGGRKG